MAKVRKNLLRFNFLLILLAVILSGIGLALICHNPAEGAVEEVKVASQAKVAGWGFLAAAISVGLSSIGAGIAVSVVGSAAMGAVAERPELMGRSLIYVGLAEGIAIYGLIVAIMILAKI
ncbi:MAG: H+transporting two-sector ATPase C subunit [Candidatus Omnitrophota bacterium]|nr:MAG: H+transporting two-sector ATPase C subunit [Candidatus Omnitrophota bacterium]